MSGQVEMIEYWVLGDWQVVQWQHVPTSPGDISEQWFTFADRGREPDPDSARYASLEEAMLVVVATGYVGNGVEDPAEAQWLAFGFARQIGMHHWDGEMEEWVHRAPGER